MSDMQSPLVAAVRLHVEMHRNTYGLTRKMTPAFFIAVPPQMAEGYNGPPTYRMEDGTRIILRPQMVDVV